MRPGVFFPIFLFAAILSGCGGSIELTSRNPSRKILIDGKDTEWRESLRFLQDQQLSVGVMNDSAFLYICLTTENRMLQRQIMRSGFTVWFDKDGGSSKTFGIQYPVPSSTEEAPEQFEQRGQPPEEHKGMMRRPAQEIVLFEGGRENKTLYSLVQLPEIKAALSFDEDDLIYELRVPLYSEGTKLRLLGLDRKSKITVGFETVENASGSGEGDGMRGDRPVSGGSRGGRGGGRMGGGGRGGGMQGGGDAPRMNKQMQLWTTVQLTNTGIQ